MFLSKLDYQTKKHGLTRPELAKAIHIPYTTLVTWYTSEKEVDNIRAGILKRLSELFDVPLEYWFEGGLDYKKTKNSKKTIEYNKQKALKEMIIELNKLSKEFEDTFNTNDED